MALTFHLDDLAAPLRISLRRVKRAGVRRGRPAFVPVGRDRAAATETLPMSAQRMQRASNPGAPLSVLQVSADS